MKQLFNKSMARLMSLVEGVIRWTLRDTIE